MQTRAFGDSGLQVSIVGLGAGSIGEATTPDAEVEQLLNTALDAGVTLVDTARSYGLSEERLGSLLQGRRQRVVLSTKIGYDMAGIPDWTGPCIEAGVDAALRRLRTDWLDIVHLHSCGLDVLQRGDVVAALGRAVEAGKVRVAAYSGEGEALRWAVTSGAFGAVQCSVSVVDQASLFGAVALAKERGLGVLAKRALGNAPWRFTERPAAPDVAEAWERFRALELDPGPLSHSALFTRFAAFAPGVDAVLVGTRQPAHLLAAIAEVAHGPLPEDVVLGLRAGFERVGANWGGRI
ncbi:MAG: aldo/keto reductase [Myxococcales bacterium]|nr:aldo/keto reductase [Myxococcales bacterium]